MVGEESGTGRKFLAPGGGRLAGAASLGARQPSGSQRLPIASSPFGSEAAGAGGRGSPGEVPGSFNFQGGPRALRGTFRSALSKTCAHPRLPHLPQRSPHRPDRDHARSPVPGVRCFCRKRPSAPLRTKTNGEVLLFPGHQPLCIHRLRVLCRCSWPRQLREWNKQRGASSRAYSGSSSSSSSSRHSSFL